MDTLDVKQDEHTDLESELTLELDALVGLPQIKSIEDYSYKIIDSLRERVFAPDSRKQLELRFSMTQVAKMVGRSANAIRNYEKEGKLPQPVVNEQGRRTGYTLEQVNLMRDVFKTRPRRGKDDECITLAIQNFKGGVGKSTLTCHLSQYLALKGFRVLVIDCDPQASTTNIFGINPDFDLEEEDCILNCLLHGQSNEITDVIRQTYWDGIDIVPSNLSLYNAEYILASSIAGDINIFDRLQRSINQVKDNYDVILIDPPPALGMISLSVLRAADALLVPVAPSTVDFSSTANFFTMLNDVLETLESKGLAAKYKFLKVVASKVNENKSAHLEISRMMQTVYGNNMLQAALKDSAEIDNASARLMTVYELTGPQTSRSVHSRCKAFLNAVCGEIEQLILETWPSHSDKLNSADIF